jgi:hypothetical protein
VHLLKIPKRILKKFEIYRNQTKDIINEICEIPENERGYDLNMLLVKAYVVVNNIASSFLILTDNAENGKNDSLWHYYMGHCTQNIQSQEEYPNYKEPIEYYNTFLKLATEHNLKEEERVLIEPTKTIINNLIMMSEYSDEEEDDNQTFEEVIENNPLGHLPLSDRIMIREQLEDCNLINKTYFECAKKVYSLWKAEYPDNDIVYEILKKAEDYLYKKKGTKKDFIKLADKYKNYIEDISSNAGAAGFTALSLCYHIGTDAAFDEDYNGYEDDNSFYYEDCLPDFFGSVAFSGGNPFSTSNFGNLQKRREYWIWYISIANALLENSDKPILPLVK